MIESYAKDIEAQMQELYSRLPEKNRRLYAGVEALKLPYGGISYIAGLFSRSRDIVSAGIKESMRIVFDKHLGQWNYVA